MTDRKPTYPHRVQLTKEDGSQEIVTWEYADNPIVEGTPLSKANLLDDQTGAMLLPEVEDPTVNQAFAALAEKMKSLGAVTVTLPVSGWQGSEAPYTQQVSAEGITAAWIPGLPVAQPQELSNPELVSLREAAGYIGKIESGEGYLIFTCPENKPEVDMTLKIPGVM